MPTIMTSDFAPKLLMHPEQKMRMLAFGDAAGAPGHKYAWISPSRFPLSFHPAHFSDDGIIDIETGKPFRSQYYAIRKLTWESNGLKQCLSPSFYYYIYGMYHRVILKRAANRRRMDGLSWSAVVEHNRIDWYVRCPQCKELILIRTQRGQEPVTTSSDPMPRSGWVEDAAIAMVPISGTSYIYQLGSCIACARCYRHFWTLLDRRTS